MKTTDDFIYPAADIWAAAVAAQRINKEYIKITNYSDLPSNYGIMGYILRGEAAGGSVYVITDDDREQAVIIRKFFQNLMFEYLQGSLAGYMTAAFQVSLLENININDMDMTPLIASLPSTWAGEQKKINNRRAIDALEAASTPWGKVGQKLPDNFDIRVVTSVYSKKFGTFAINTVQDNHLFFFWWNCDLKENSILRVCGRVKQHYKNRTTQLSIVKGTVLDATN